MNTPWPDEAHERRIKADAELLNWNTAPDGLYARCAESITRLLERVRVLEQREAIALYSLKKIAEADVYARQIALEALEKLNAAKP